MQRKRIVAKAVRVCVSAAFLVVVLRMANLEKVWSNLVHLNIWLYILGNLLNFGRVFVSAYRWKILLEVKNISVSMNPLSAIYFIGIFFNMFLPTALGAMLQESFISGGSVERK
jgi:uncharacterized membrane protein YbhN (UPF0104 family)